MDYIKLIRQPDISMVAGLKVTKDTVLEHKTDNVEQKLENLEFVSVSTNSGDNYKVKQEVRVHLNEGDIVIFESEERGYVVPLNKYMTVKEAIKELECVDATTGGKDNATN